MSGPLFDAKDVELDWSHRDEEPHRRDRLLMVLGFVEAISNDTIKKVSSIKDSKGMLEVSWKRLPQEHDKAAFMLAWHSSIGDGCDSVYHYLDGREIK